MPPAHLGVSLPDRNPRATVSCSRAPRPTLVGRAALIELLNIGVDRLAAVIHHRQQLRRFAAGVDFPDADVAAVDRRGVVALRFLRRWRSAFRQSSCWGRCPWRPGKTPASHSLAPVSVELPYDWVKPMVPVGTSVVKSWSAYGLPEFPANTARLLPGPVAPAIALLRLTTTALPVAGMSLLLAFVAVALLTMPLSPASRND